MKDKVANVFLTSVSVFTSLVDMYAPVVGPRDVEAASEAALPLIIDKLGDNNARLRCVVQPGARPAPPPMMAVCGTPPAPLIPSQCQDRRLWSLRFVRHRWPTVWCGRSDTATSHSPT